LRVAAAVDGIAVRLPPVAFLRTGTDAVTAAKHGRTGVCPTVDGRKANADTACAIPARLDKAILGATVPVAGVAVVAGLAVLDHAVATNGHAGKTGHAPKTRLNLAHVRTTIAASGIAIVTPFSRRDSSVATLGSEPLVRAAEGTTSAKAGVHANNDPCIATFKLAKR
jgi:hypothetical protein